MFQVSLQESKLHGAISMLKEARAVVSDAAAGDDEDEEREAYQAAIAMDEAEMKADSNGGREG